MNNSDKKIVIDQLRKEKMIYGIESVSLTAVCSLGLEISFYVTSKN